MAPNRSTVASVAPRYGSKTPASSASVVSTPTSARPLQPGVPRTQDTFDKVQAPAPPIDPVSAPPPARLTPRPTNNTHVRSGVDVVAQRIDVAAGGVQDLTSFARGLLKKWPLEKFERFWRGIGTEGEMEPPRIPAKQFESTAEDDVDGPQAQQEEDAMANKAPPPYPQSWIQGLDDKGA